MNWEINPFGKLVVVDSEESCKQFLQELGQRYPNEKRVVSIAVPDDIYLKCLYKYSSSQIYICPSSVCMIDSDTLTYTVSDHAVDNTEALQELNTATDSALECVTSMMEAAKQLNLDDENAADAIRKSVASIMASSQLIYDLVGNDTRTKGNHRYSGDCKCHQKSSVKTTKYANVKGNGQDFIHCLIQCADTRQVILDLPIPRDLYEQVDFSNDFRHIVAKFVRTIGRPVLVRFIGSVND